MNDFDRVKTALPLLQAITAETGLAMQGPHLAECPFCQGHGCFSIKEERYHCFQCEAAGDVFNFLEKYHSISKAEGLKKAADMAGIELAVRKPKDSAGMNLTVKDAIFIEAALHYNSNVSLNGGKTYLIEKRGHKEALIERMQVGWSTGELIEHLRGKGFADEQILASGLAKEKEIEGRKVLLDFFGKGLAVFPHWNKDKVLHFTMKDPKKTLAYQLPKEARSKDWRFYNQDALEKYNELIVVEGENDLLSVLGAGVQSVIGLIGQPADYQLKAMQTHCRQKHLYLWLDNDEGGKKFIRQICKAVPSNIRIIAYNEGLKDPDEYIRQFKGDLRKEVKRLQDEALDFISWEIKEILRFPTLEERLKALKDRHIFSAVAEMVEAEKQVFVQKLMRLDFSREAIEEQLEVNHDLRNQLAIYFERVPKKDADPNYVAGLIFKSLSETGKFFRDRMSDVYLLHHHHIYHIGNNRPFNAIIKKLTGLLPTKEPGRSVWESLASEAYNAGLQIDLASWIHTDRTTDTIYINLNIPNNAILKISAKRIEEIPNGINKEGVLLKSSKKILPVNFHPDADIREGLQDLKDLIIDNMTCEREQRYLILCWFMSAFMLDFSPYMGLMKFSGPSSSGKTTTAKLLSILMYGNDHLSDPSAAAAYAVASQNPLLIIDNLESDDVTKSILKFLLLSATKGGKEKRTQGTDSDTIQEQPKALVLITAIEPFLKAELINRTFDIDFSFKHKSDGFIEDDVISQVTKKRDRIISAMLKFISIEILPELEQRKDFIIILKKEFKNHAKNRTDEYLALLMLMCEKLLKYIPMFDASDFLAGTEEEGKEIRKAWIEYQNKKARDTETSSNTIIKLLDGLVREYSVFMKGLQPESHPDYAEEVFSLNHKEYLLEVIKTKPKMCCSLCNKPVDAGDDDSCVCKEAQSSEVYSRAFFEFTATSGEVVHAFDRYCRNNGIKNPFEKASVFGSRLNNDRPLLKKYGWDLVVRDETIDPYYKRIQGNRFYRFRKVIVR